MGIIYPADARMNPSRKESSDEVIIIYVDGNREGAHAVFSLCRNLLKTSTGMTIIKENKGGVL